MPSFYLPKVPLYDPMVDTPESAIQRLSIITNRNFDVMKRLLYGQLDGVNVRSGGILLEQLMGGLLPQTPDALGEGLNLTSEYMGFYDGEDWRVFIRDDGIFYLSGNEDNYLLWDGDVLFVGGHLDAVTGTFEVIGAGDFPDGSKVLLGHIEGEPLFEMYDGDETLRLRIEKDRISFYTEFVEGEGEEEDIDSVYAGMIQGLYWTVEDKIYPEVRLETPTYLNILAVDEDFFAKFCRLSCMVNDIETTTRLEAANIWESGGDTSLPVAFSSVQLDQDWIGYCEFGDIYLMSKEGDVLVPHRMVLYGETTEDHLQINLYDEEEDENFVFKLTHTPSTKAATFIIEEDCDTYNFYIGVNLIFQIDNTGGGAGGNEPCIRMWSDLDIAGDLYVVGDIFT